MPRYIDADALKDELELADFETDSRMFGGQTVLFKDSVFKIVDSAPTISPDEVRGVGKWIKREKVRPNLPDDSDYEFECSCCGWRDLHNAKMIVPYCWHCGAKMEVSEDA